MVPGPLNYNCETLSTNSFFLKLKMSYIYIYKSLLSTGQFSRSQNQCIYEHLRKNLVTCLIFVVILAAIGLERGADMQLH